MTTPAGGHRPPPTFTAMATAGFKAVVDHATNPRNMIATGNPLAMQVGMAVHAMSSYIKGRRP